jgi:2-polyprenyl-6-methoxyphenol hydroxylase-like FAD-dependent oxidoreductase
MDGKAVIIGAGIGGLAAARALRQYGWDVTVLERASTLPRTGTTLGLWPQALRALDAVGAGQAIRNDAARLDSDTAARTGLRTPAGRTLVTTPGPPGIGLVSRPRLLEVLADEVAVTFDASVDDPGVHDSADVVIGADGAFSRTREVLFGPGYRARSLHAVAWRGTVSGTVDAYGETWAPGALFGTTPTGRAATNWYACLRADYPYAGPHLSRLEELFGSWHAGVQDVLGRVDEDSILHHELVESPRLLSYVSGSTALLGDAAHAMGPFLGRGACEALVDGVTLGRCLASAGTVGEALLDYDRERRPPTQRLVRASASMGRIAMMGTGSAVRNSALTAVAGALRLAGALRR